MAKWGVAEGRTASDLGQRWRRCYLDLASPWVHEDFGNCASVRIDHRDRTKQGVPLWWNRPAAGCQRFTLLSLQHPLDAASLHKGPSHVLHAALRVALIT